MRNKRRPLVNIVTGYMCGIGASYYFNFSFFVLIIGFMLSSLVLLLVQRNNRIFRCVLFVTLIILGAIQANSVKIRATHDISRDAKYHRKADLKIEGVVISDIQMNTSLGYPRGRLILKVRKTQAPWGWQDRHGKILVRFFRELNLQYGDVIRIQGKLHSPYNFSQTDNFSYPEYLEHKGIDYVLSVKNDSPFEIISMGSRWSVKRLSLEAQGYLKNILDHYLTPKESGIIKAILLGDRSEIPKPIRALFVQTGTAHILAISGLHIGMIAFVLFLLISGFPVPRSWKIFITVALMILYAIMTGARPSVVRATVMSIVFLISHVIEREPDSWNTLALAAWILLLINPGAIFDIGFQLSFICVISILWISPLLEGTLGKGISKLFKCDKKNKWIQGIIQSLCVSIAVWIGVSGLVVYYFEIVTPISIVANLIVVPLLTCVVVLGLGLLMLGGFWGYGAQLFALCLKMILNILAGSVFLLSQCPGGRFIIKDINPYYIYTYYVFVLVGIMICYKCVPQIDKG